MPTALIDARPLQLRRYAQRGIGSYARAVLRALAEHAHEHGWRVGLLVYEGRAASLDEDRATLAALPRVCVGALPAIGALGRLLNATAEPEVRRAIEQARIDGRGVDVVHFLEPFEFPVAFAGHDRGADGAHPHGVDAPGEQLYVVHSPAADSPAAPATVVTVHDLIPLTASGGATDRPLRKRIGRWLSARGLARSTRADWLICDSEHTRRQLLALSAFPQARTSVVSPWAAGDARSDEADAEPSDEALEDAHSGADAAADRAAERAVRRATGVRPAGAGATLDGLPPDALLAWARDVPAGYVLALAGGDAHKNAAVMPRAYAHALAQLGPNAKRAAGEGARAVPDAGSDMPACLVHFGGASARAAGLHAFDQALAGCVADASLTMTLGRLAYRAPSPDWPRDRRRSYRGILGTALVPIKRFLPREVLRALIAGARAVVVPSLDEGFGLPVVEAMELGVPVVCSDVASLPEAAGGAALLVDARDPAALGDAIARVLTDEREAERLRAAGRSRAALLTPRRLAEATLAAYGNALVSRGGRGAGA